MLNRLLKLSAIALSCGILATTVSGCSQTPEESKVYTIEDTINRIKAARPNFVEEKLEPVVLYDGYQLCSDKTTEGKCSINFPTLPIYGTITIFKGMGNRTIYIDSLGPDLQIKSMYYPTGKYLETIGWQDGLNTFNIGDKYGYTNHFYPIIGTIKKDSQTTEYLLNPNPLHLPLNKNGNYAGLCYQYDEKMPLHCIKSNQIVSIEGKEGKLIRNTPGFINRKETIDFIEVPLNRHYTKKYTEELSTKQSIEYLISLDNIKEVNILKFNKKQGNNLYLTYYTYKMGGYKDEYRFVIPNKKNHIFSCGNDKFRLKEYKRLSHEEEYLFVEPIGSQFKKFPIAPFVNYQSYIDHLNLSHSPQ